MSIFNRITIVGILAMAYSLHADTITVHNETDQKVYLAIYIVPDGTGKRFGYAYNVPPHDTVKVIRPDRECKRKVVGKCVQYADRNLYLSFKSDDLKEQIGSSALPFVNVGNTRGDEFYIGQEGNSLVGYNAASWAGKRATRKVSETAETVAKKATEVAGKMKSSFNDAADDLKKAFADASAKVKESADKAANVFKEMASSSQDFVANKLYNEGLKGTVWKKGIVGTIVKKGIVPAAGEVLLFSKISAQAFRNWFGKKLVPEYCPNVPASLHDVATVDDPDVQKEDIEGLIPYIKKYAPVSYIEKEELYYPMWITEWCLGPQTSILDRSSGKTVIPAGKVTFDNVFELYRQSRLPAFTAEKKKLDEQINGKKLANEQLAKANARLAFLNRVIDYKSAQPVTGSINYEEVYFNNPRCADYGSNPALNKDAEGNLTTPCYVATSEQNGNIYIYYTYFYGFNGPYDIGPFTGDVFDVQNAHEADYEHVTIEIDKNTKNIKRIFYAAHGSTEGLWLDAHHPDIQYEGTHPVTFVARGGHGDYPKSGTYVRIFGIANDITGKDVRWTPKLVRFYPPEDPRFNPKTMGWVVMPGSMGRRGVSAPIKQGWFMNVSGDIGQKYEAAQFCENPTEGKDGAYISCIAKKLPAAKPPAGEWD